MELVLKDTQSTLTVSKTTFSHDFNKALVHQVVVAYAAGAHQGTHAQKTHAEVTGSIKSPIWRSGGMTFAAHPQDHSQKVNKKMYHSTLKSILSKLVHQDHLIIVKKFSVEAPKTKLLAQKLKDMALEDVLIITSELDKNLFLAAHNLHKVDIHDATGINPVSLITFNKVIMTADAVKQVEEMLA